MRKEVIDVEDVLDRVQDDRELFIELLDIFQEDYQIKIGQLREFLQGGEAEKVRDIAHSIKGASGNISARKMFACAERIEHLAEGGDLSEVPRLVDEMESCFVELQACIVEVKKELS